MAYSRSTGEPDHQSLLRTSSSVWRWVLIVAELLVAAELFCVLTVRRAPGEVSGPFLILGVAAFVAWLFLFFGSPFLIRSHRPLAILGWCIALLALLLSGSR